MLEAHGIGYLQRYHFDRSEPRRPRLELDSGHATPTLVQDLAALRH